MEEQTSLAALLLIETITLARCTYTKPFTVEEENYGEGDGTDLRGEYRN